jgi:IS5 family transposase
MDQVVSWTGLIKLIEPHYHQGEGGRPAYPLMAMLRVHLRQNWFGYSAPAMEEALYETTILRQFPGLSLERIPDETTILNFRWLLEKHELAAGILQVTYSYLGDPGAAVASRDSGRCDDHSCAELDQEQGRKTRSRDARDEAKAIRIY